MSDIAFIADVHLGRLARNLRLLGFDCLFRNDYSDETMIDISEKTGRIILTRDVQMLKNIRVKHGHWIRSTDHRVQTGEVLKRFQLSGRIQPFTRCCVCNGIIHEVPKESIREFLEPNTERYFSEFYQCGECKKIYWKGSHYDRMMVWLEEFMKST